MAPSTARATANDSNDRRAASSSSASPSETSSCSCDRSSSHICDIHTDRAPGVSSSADLPPSTLLRNRNNGSGKADVANRWKTVRPWKPPASSSTEETTTTTTAAAEEQPSGSTSPSNSLRMPSNEPEDETFSLEVIDVSSTAIALGIFGLQTGTGSDDASAPQISIRLNRAAWPHVFHSPSSTDDEDGEVRETVVVFGLEPGREYEVELAVIGGRRSAGLPFTTPAAHDTTADADLEPEDAPPPYSPSPLPAASSTSSTTGAEPAAVPQPTEASLKAQLKKLRTTAKASETSLQSSIHSLQRALERTAKEDQRTRQRLIALDDGARKLREAAAQDNVEADEALGELPEIEREAAERQAQLTARRSEVQLREREVTEQMRQDDEVLTGLQRQVDELRERTEGVKQESERYEREVLEDLTARLAHLDQQLESGEISPSFLSALQSGFPGAHRGPPPGLGKGTTGSLNRRERKASAAGGGKTSSGPASKTTTPPASATLPRIVPGLPGAKKVDPTPPASSTATTTSFSTPSPPPTSPPATTAFTATGPAPGDEEVPAPEKSGWRAWGAVGETWARAAQRSKPDSS